MSRFEGTCLCKSIEFKINGEPTATSCCHCKNCKKYTGTVFTTNLVFPVTANLEVTKGKELIKIFHDTVQDSGNAIDRHFCSNCGSPLYNTNGDFGRSIAVFYSALENVEEKAPEIEYYSKDRVSWLPQFEGSERSHTKPGRDN